MRRTRAFLLSAMFIALVSRADAADLPIVAGDTLDISIFGMPEMQKRAIVNEDGRILYPLLGPVSAEGLTGDQLRQSLTDQLVNGALLKDPKIGVEIVARAPFIVTGDVAKPGVEPYAPNMTIRSAVSLAGGVDLGDMPGERSETQTRDSHAQYEAAAFDYVRQRAHLLRLESELAGDPKVEPAKYPALPISQEVVDRLNALELRDLQARRDATGKEKAYLKEMIAKTGEQLAALAQRRQAQEGDIREREEEVLKFKGLADRGIIVQNRVFDEQRSLALMKSSLYESVASEAQATRMLDEYEYKLASIDETRKSNVIKEMQDAYVATAAAESRLNRAQKLKSAGHGSKAVSYVIHRRSNGRQEQVEADDQTEVHPGDLIEVDTGAGTTVASH